MTRLFAGTPFDRPPRCEQCEELEEDCTCPPPPIQYLDPAKQTARISKEKRKRGKIVTTIQGLVPAESNLPDLLKTLKNRCGAGGTIKEDVIEIQGDHLDQVRSILSEIGYKTK